MAKKTTLDYELVREFVDFDPADWLDGSALDEWNRDGADVNYNLLRTLAADVFARDPKHAGHTAEAEEAAAQIATEFIAARRASVVEYMTEHGYTLDEMKALKVGTLSDIVREPPEAERDFDAPKTEVEFDFAENFSFNGLRNDVLIYVRHCHLTATRAAGAGIDPDAGGRFVDLIDGLISRRWDLEPEAEEPAKNPKAAGASVPKRQIPDGLIIPHAHVTHAIMTQGREQDFTIRNGRNKVNVKRGSTAKIQVQVREPGHLPTVAAEILEQYRMDGYDIGVHNSICTLINPFVDGTPLAEYGTIPLFRVLRKLDPSAAYLLGGKAEESGKLATKQAKDLCASLGKQNGFMAWIGCPVYDHRTGQKIADNSPQFRSILANKIVYRTVDGRDNVPCVQLLDVPVLFDYARQIGQIKCIKPETLMLPGLSYTRTNIAIQQYLLMVSMHAIKCRWKRLEIPYADIYKAASISAASKKTKLAAIKSAGAILKAWEARGLIAGVDMGVRTGRDYMVVIKL